MTEQRTGERRRWLTPEEVAAEFAAICADWPALARVERRRIERRNNETANGNGGTGDAMAE
jgi:hypothetical protein